MAIRFLKRDRDYAGYKPTKKAQYREVDRIGKVYRIAGEEIELFKISTLAEALDRTVVTLLQWEAAGFLPKPMFEVPGVRAKRWYSAAQVLNLHRLMMGKYGGLKYIHNKNLFEMFIKDVQAIFYQRRVVIAKNGETL